MRNTSLTIHCLEMLSSAPFNVNSLIRGMGKMLEIYIHVHYYFFSHLFLLKFDLPTYSITPNAHPIKCPPQCASPSHPSPYPPPLLLSFVCFPELRVSWFVILSNFSHSLPLLFPIIPFTISYIPHMSETI